MKKVAVLLVVAMVPFAAANILELALDGTDTGIGLGQNWNGDVYYQGGAAHYELYGNGNFMDPDDPNYPDPKTGWYMMVVPFDEPQDFTGMTQITYEGRYYQEEFDYYADDGIEGELTGDIVTRQPYVDAVIGMRLRTIDGNGLKFNAAWEWPIDTAMNANFPDFSTGVIEGDMFLPHHVDDNPTGYIEHWWGDAGAVFTPSNVVQIDFYGTDWYGRGNDWIEIRNFTVVPEPAALLALVLGGLLIRRR